MQLNNEYLASLCVYENLFTIYYAKQYAHAYSSPFSRARVLHAYIRIVFYNIFIVFNILRV